MCSIPISFSGWPELETGQRSRMVLITHPPLAALPVERDASSRDSPILVAPTGEILSEQNSTERWKRDITGTETALNNFIGHLFFLSFFAPFWFHLGDRNKDRSILFKILQKNSSEKEFPQQTAHEQSSECDWKGSFSCSRNHPGFWKDAFWYF